MNLATEAARAAALAVACLAGGVAAAADCAPAVADLRDSDAALRFSIEVADTEEERSQGLMFRESLPQFAGMLFVYDKPQPVAFWMHNTLIPLDMLFFDGSGRLVSIHPNARPHDDTPIPGGADIRYVLEINGGLASSLGIEPGAELRSPALDQDQVAWRCE